MDREHEVHANIDMDANAVAIDGLTREVTKLSERLDQFIRDSAKREAMAHRAQWPLVLGAAAVLLSFGAIMTTVLIAAGGLVAVNIASDNERLERQIITIANDQKVWAERLAGVAATANSGASVSGDNRRLIEQGQEANKEIIALDAKHYDSTNYRLGRLERGAGDE